MILHDTVDKMYVAVAKELKQNSNMIESRNGDTYEIHPHFYGSSDFTQYMLTVKGRVINFPFALAELIWIMQGSESTWITNYNSRMSNYVDEFVPGHFIFNAAYGHRLKYDYAIDQIENIIKHFQNSKNTRHAVMVMSHPLLDSATKQTKDRACNISSMYLIRDNKLDLTQTARSHDFIWGLPYNLIQFGYITQWISERIGVKVGKIYELSNSLHVYRPMWKDVDSIKENISMDGYDLTMPAIGDSTDHRTLASIEHMIRDLNISETLKEGKKDQDYLNVEQFYKKNIKPIESEFWHDGLCVLLSYWVKHFPDISLSVLDWVKSDLFRFMALRYYITYWRNKWGDIADGGLVYDYIKDKYDDSLVVDWLKET